MNVRFGDLGGRGPLGLKIKSPKKQSRRARQGKLDPEYLRDVRRLPCIICDAFGFQQASETQAHHTFCGRFGQDKSPDREAIPLCEGHHQGEWDITKIAIHADKALWVDHYGSDRDYIAVTLDAVERLRQGDFTR